MVPKSLEGYIMANPMVVPITMVRNGIDGRSLGIDSIFIAYSAIFCIISFLFGCMIFKHYEAKAVKKL